MQKLAKQTSKDHEYEHNEKYTKRQKDLMWFDKSTYVHKEDEQSTINMRVQNTKRNNLNQFTRNTWEVHTCDNVLNLWPTISPPNQNSQSF